jgi:hypothetical protein
MVALHAAFCLSSFVDVMQTKITGAKVAETEAQLGNSGSKNNGVPAVFGSPHVGSAPFGSPATFAVPPAENGTDHGSGTERVRALSASQSTSNCIELQTLGNKTGRQV